MRAAYNETPFASGGKGGFGLATFTEHYGLHQWEATDDFLRTDFNTDFAKIDEAIGKAAEKDYVAGTYTGDGAAERVIELGFQPSVMFLERSTGERGASYGKPVAGMLLPGFPLNGSTEITQTGFKVYHGTTVADPQQNSVGAVYRYLAFH